MPTEPTPAPADAPQQPAPTPPTATLSTPADEPLGPAGKAALDAERKARKELERQLREANERLQAIEDKDKSELERTQARLAELEKNYAAEQQQRLRLQVATAHGISSDDLVLLTGTTEEELVAQATRIAELNAARAAATAPPAFAPNPAQQAGNASPAPPAATVQAGRELYRATKQKSHA